MPTRPEQRDPVELLGEEFMDRHRRGERPTIREYAESHPKLADGIRNLFPTMLALEQFKTGAIPAPELSHERPDQLGDYCIKFEIGRGGMGVVYEAEQQSLGRRVAVKVFPKQTIKDSRQLQRFNREARTAASLHHTNIVAVFGVGEQEGLHYYVMQRIHGIGLDLLVGGFDTGTETEPVPDNAAKEVPKSIRPGKTANLNRIESAVTLFFDREPLGANGKPASPRSIAQLALLRNRKQYTYWRGVADIGMQVAAALEYAHAQGVVHRDIKPANLLRDAKGTVWVTDFGLATAIEAERLSRPGDLVGTLRFMAPELMAGEYDARSDIYGLGVTLYELLTFEPAFDEPTRHQLAQKILKGEAKAPRRICAMIPRDLEAIVLKAMEREPRRRYQSAAELTHDLRRFLEDRPVRARPIGFVGRWLRWTRRNPLVAALSASLVVVLLGSLVGISAKWQEAVSENRRAEDNLSLALESMDQILERFASSWMAQPLVTSEETQESGVPTIDYQIVVSDYSAEVLKDALKFYDQFAKQNASNPVLQRDTAKVHRRVGDIYERLGQSSKAEAAYLRALEILDSQVSTDATYVIERAVTRNQLGLALRSTSGPEEAAAEFRSARQLLENSRASESPTFQYELARTNINLGQTLLFSRQRHESNDRHREAIQLLEGLVREDPRDVDYRLALARAYRVYYPGLLFRGRGDDAERIRVAGVSLLERLVQEFPAVPDYRCELSEMLLTTSRRRDPGDLSQAVEPLQRAVDLARQLSNEHPSIPRYHAVLAHALKEQAESLEKYRPDKADELLLESVTIYRSLADSFKDNPAYHTFLALALQDRGDNLVRLRRHADASAALAEAIDCQQVYLNLRPESRFGSGSLLRMYDTLIPILHTLGQQAEADHRNEELEILRSRFPSRSDRRRS